MQDYPMGCYSDTSTSIILRKLIRMGACFFAMIVVHIVPWYLSRKIQAVEGMLDEKITGDLSTDKPFRIHISFSL